MRRPNALRTAWSLSWIVLASLPIVANAQVGDAPTPGTRSTADVQQRRLELKSKLEQRRLEMKNRMVRPPRSANVITRFSLKNETPSTIWAALYYLPYADPSNTAGIQTQGAESPWRLESWIVLNPGETRYVGETNNLTFYTYATNAEGRTWGGNDFRRSLYFNSPAGYREVGFKKHTNDTHPDTFTYGFIFRTP